jgi:hypothetical protein
MILAILLAFAALAGAAADFVLREKTSLVSRLRSLFMALASTVVSTACASGPRCNVRRRWRVCACSAVFLRRHVCVGVHGHQAP